MPGNPFLLHNETSYRAWRECKLRDYPRSLDELLVEIADPHALSTDEHAALLARCRKTNLALYMLKQPPGADKRVPRDLGLQFGLNRLDHNMLADDDAISSLTVAESGTMQGEFIPYTDRPIRWHTDGYYNAPSRRVRALLLHCVSPAAEGGSNALIDHEIVYLLLRDENPATIAALMQPDAMSIPARMDEHGVARPAETGPVFSVLSDGSLHMRYTARTRSIAWKDDEATRAAVASLERLLASDLPWIFRGRLEAGMGLISNNIVHDRTGFTDSAEQQRLIYRARYHDRIHGT